LISNINFYLGNDGRLFTGTIDSNNRYKQISVDSNTLINTSNDSTLINKSNGNINNRGIPINPIQISQQDIMSRSDNGFEYSTSPSISLKRRAITNSALFSNRSSERFLPIPKWYILIQQMVLIIQI